jgi:SOS-response transcriptional repressor LexA
MRFKPEGLTPNAWAVSAGVSRTVWADMRRHGNPSRKTLEKLLSAIGSSVAEFEALRLGPDPRQFSNDSSAAALGDTRRSWTPAHLPPLPLIGSTLAGEWRQPGSQVELIELRTSEIIDRLLRPASLGADPDAFALTILGNSMWPRFQRGSRVAVSPRSPVAISDDVLVRLRAGHALILRLIDRTAKSYELRQFNPNQTIELDADEVEAVQRIAGELI